MKAFPSFTPYGRALNSNQLDGYLVLVDIRSFTMDSYNLHVPVKGCSQLFYRYFTGALW